MSERRKLPSLFEAGRLAERLKLELKANPDINEASWGAWFGPVQEALRNKKWEGQDIRRCHVDLTECRWADPLPLLSLGLSLVEFEQNGGSVSIAFPSPYISDGFGVPGDWYDSKDVEPTRLLKYLAREGLFQLLAFPKTVVLPQQSAPIPTERTITIGPETLAPADRSETLKKLAEHWAPLAFEESTCLKATMLRLHRPKEPGDSAPLDAIDEWVERTLYRDIAQVIYDKVPRWAQRGLTYRLLMFLRETLHNVAEHAYAESGLAAVYVRYREGALGQAPSTWTRLDEYVRRENNNLCTPLLRTKGRGTSFARARTGFFEVYVVDAGKGLSRTLRRSPSPSESDPVHQTMLAVFDSWCSSKSQRMTEYGGLYLIRLLLEPLHDYVRVRDEDTWWGTELPIPMSNRGVRLAGQIALRAYGHEHTGTSICGLAWTGRLSWLERTDTPGHSWHGLEREDENVRLLSVLQEVNTDLSILDGSYICDCRFAGEPWNQTIPAPEQPRGLVLLLPGSNWMRNHIQNEIARVLTKGCLAQGGSLIVGDIASEEALTYLAAIQNAWAFTIPPLSIPARVVLVTRDLKVCVLKRDNKHLFRAQDSLSRTFVRRRSIGVGRVPASHSLAEYFRLLRLHDGHRLWEIVGPTRILGGQLPSRYMPDTFLDERVDWNNDIVLDCYLDFPQTITHPTCREIYTISLNRLTGLFPEQDCDLTALDSLVDSLIVRFNADQHPRPRFKQDGGQGSPGEPLRKRLRIGSVQVSGLTEQSSNEGDTPVFYFFRHPNGTANGHYLLPWLASPSGKPLALPFGGRQLPPGAYRRVGRTPVIARDGWKAYPMPRFDEHDQPICEQGPRDSYRAWQEPSRTTMKIGHWSYGGHHDLLSINLILAFDTEMDRISLVLAGSLARWVYANLFRIFALESAHLTDAGQRLLKAIANDKYRRLLPEGLAQQEPLVVYPSHPVTDHIVDRFLSVVADHDRLKMVRARMLAILPIRRHRGGSGLQISGLTLERLEMIRVGRRKKRPPVVFFDDAVISGRTYEEVKRLLRSKGFKDVYSLVLLDRQRLPSADHIAGKRHVCYWRLDVPALGSSARCPLCRALARVKDLSARIASDEHRRRINIWQEHWAARNPTTDWGDSGLRPSPLLLTKAERKFGIVPDRNRPGSYRQIGGAGQRIRLTNSAGLAASVTELHSITSRDDLPLRWLENENLDAEVRIQLVASQLLLFFGELDAALAHDLGLRLVAALWDAKEHDRNTALAALTLVACGNEFLSRTMREFMKDEVRKCLTTPPDKDLIWANVDFVILLAFCLDLGVVIGSRELDRASRLLKPTGTRRDLYYRLHREVQDVQGKAHSSPLRHHLNQWEAPPLGFEKSIPDIVASVGQIKAVATGLERHWLRADTDVHKKFGEVQGAIQANAEELERRLRDLRDSSRSTAGNTPNADFQQCRHLATALLEDGGKLHAAVFVPIGIQTIHSERDCMLLHGLRDVLPPTGQVEQKRIELHRSTALSDELDVARLEKGNLQEAYAVWDLEVTWALRELLTNVKCAEGAPIDCPWKNCGHDRGTAHMWVRLMLEQNYALIELGNRTPKTAEQVQEETHLSHSHHVFRDLGGKVSFKKTDGLLFTRIYLPFAHTLGLPGEEVRHG